MPDLTQHRLALQDTWKEAGGCQACRGLGVREVMAAKPKPVHSLTGAGGYVMVPDGDRPSTWQPCSCPGANREAGLDPTLTREEVRRAMERAIVESWRVPEPGPKRDAMLMGTHTHEEWVQRDRERYMTRLWPARDDD